MNNSLITVFGGTGFLGRHTVRALARAGYRIRVAVRYPNDGFFLRPMGHVGQIDIVKCNVRNADQIAAAVHGASGVVNLVGILFQRGRQRFEAVHVGAAAAISKAAREAGATRSLHRAEQANPLFDWRVRIEEVVEEALVIVQRVREVELRGRLVRFLQRLRIVAYLLQGARQRLRVS